MKGKLGLLQPAELMDLLEEYAPEDGETAGTARKRVDLRDVGPEHLRYPMVWIDCEMTGLDPDRDTILEIACIITDGDLVRVFEGPRCVINHPDDVLDDMNDWSREQHGRSGLTDNCRASTLSLSEAEELVLEFVTGLVPQAGIAPLAGNSVHVDRNFLRRRMPRLEAHLKFRNVDVSTIAEVAMRWCPRKLKDRPSKSNTHSALVDIKESIEELRFYQTNLFGRRPKRHE